MGKKEGEKPVPNRLLKKVRRFESMLVIGIIVHMVSLFMPWYIVVLRKDDVLFSVFGVLNETFTLKFILFIFLFLVIVLYSIFTYCFEKTRRRKFIKFFGITSIILGVFSLITSITAYLRAANMQYGFYVFTVSAVWIIVVGISLVYYTKKKNIMG